MTTSPLTVSCPICNVPPGIRCVSSDDSGRIHKSRITLAEDEASRPGAPDDSGKLTDRAYLLDLSERIFRVPVEHGVDQGDYDRLRAIARRL